MGGTGPALTATVVGFDPDLDLAVLAVPGLAAEPLARSAVLAAGADAAAAGFPWGGPYAQIPEAKNVPQDTVMYKTTYEVRQIIPPLYEAAGFFREGRARIKRDNKWGVLSFRIVKNEK